MIAVSKSVIAKKILRAITPSTCGESAALHTLVIQIVSKAKGGMRGEKTIEWQEAGGSI